MLDGLIEEVGQDGYDREPRERRCPSLDPGVRGVYEELLRLLDGGVDREGR